METLVISKLAPLHAPVPRATVQGEEFVKVLKIVLHISMEYRVPILFKQPCKVNAMLGGPISSRLSGVMSLPCQLLPYS